MYRTLRCDPQLFEKDLSGRTYIVTGANSGLGLETARQLVKQGAHVVLACRRVDAGKKAAAAIASGRGTTAVMSLDLGELDSIRSFARAFLDQYDRLDALVNNAGLSAFSLQRTVDGFELMFGVNHLGHFLLTELLLDLLQASAPSRIVIVSSLIHAGSAGNRLTIHFDDLGYEKRQFAAMQAYGESKLANVLHARELAKRLEGTGVSAFSVHPGWARSDLPGSSLVRFMQNVVPRPVSPLLTLMSSSLVRFVQNVVLRPVSPLLTLMSNEDGAQTSLHCLLDDDAPNHSGAYFSQNGVLYSDKECRAGGWPMRSPNENAHDDALAQRLADVSREMVGLGV